MIEGSEFLYIGLQFKITLITYKTLTMNQQFLARDSIWWMANNSGW